MSGIRGAQLERESQYVTASTINPQEKKKKSGRGDLPSSDNTLLSNHV